MHSARLQLISLLAARTRRAQRLHLVQQQLKKKTRFARRLRTTLLRWQNGEFPRGIKVFEGYKSFYLMLRLPQAGIIMKLFISLQMFII
jgi:hypothetical protein